MGFEEDMRLRVNEDVGTKWKVAIGLWEVMERGNGVVGLCEVMERGKGVGWIARGGGVGKVVVVDERVLVWR